MEARAAVCRRSNHEDRVLTNPATKEPADGNVVAGFVRSRRQSRRPGSHEPSYARTADGNVRSWVRVRRNRWSATASVSLDTLCNLFGLRISTGGYLFFACFAIAQKRVSKLAQNCGNLRSLRCRPAGTVRSPPISLIPLRTVGSDIPVASATAAIPPSPIDSASLESGSPLRGLSAIAIISRPGSRVRALA